MPLWTVTIKGLVRDQEVGKLQMHVLCKVGGKWGWEKCYKNPASWFYLSLWLRTLQVSQTFLIAAAAFLPLGYADPCPRSPTMVPEHAT
jgi:hypothetical protein